MLLTDLETEREPHRTERIRAIQEALCGFVLDELINAKGEFYSDPMISVARTDKLNKHRKKDAGADDDADD